MLKYNILNRMKYIISESQYNLILESKKYENVFQELIDSNMEYVRKVCTENDEDDLGDVGIESCNQAELVEKIVVTDAYWITLESGKKVMNVKIMIYYSSIYRGELDADNLTYYLEQMIRKSTQMPLILNYQTTNTNKFFEW